MKTLTICCPQLKTGKVKKDFADLPSDVLSSFEVEMKTCNDWNGDFKSRKKREVAVEDMENMEEDREEDMKESLEDSRLEEMEERWSVERK